MLQENRPWDEKNYIIPKTGIARVPIETIYNTIIDNLSHIGILVPAEFEIYRAALKEMSPQELIQTLLESHIQREDFISRGGNKWMMN